MKKWRLTLPKSRLPPLLEQWMPNSVTEVSLPGTLPLPDQFDPTTIEREDPCPCGSGLKFKVCHFGPLRAEGRV